MQNRQLLVLITALASIGYGIFTKEPARVMQKAITICLECIGIG